MNLPDYIIIGAMKCGTSTLAAQLGAQPGFFMTTPKEPNFFSDDEVYARGLDWYRALYDPAAEGALKGEASTHYTKLPTYPRTIERLTATGAQPKLIYMVRDPIQRLISHYIHEWTMGKMTAPLEKAVSQHPELRAYSRYGEQMAPWVDAFGAKNILLIDMAKMSAEPQQTLNQVGSFLDRPGLTWKRDLDRVNVSAERMRRLPLHDILIDSAPATWARRTFVPKALRDRIRSSRQIHTRPVINEMLQTDLSKEFCQDGLRLLSMFPDRQDLASLYPEVA